MGSSPIGTPAGDSPCPAGGRPKASDHDRAFIGRVVGVLFLGAFLLCGTGSLLVMSIEAALLAVGIAGVPLVVLAAAAGDTGLARILVEGNGQALQVAMVGLGIGSVPFFWALGRERLIPRFLAAWGALGYAIFATGAVLEILNVPVGVWLAAPAGLFEVAFAAYLLVRSMPLDRNLVLGP